MTRIRLYVNDSTQSYICQYQPSLTMVEMTQDEKERCKFNYLSVPMSMLSDEKQLSSDEVTQLIGHVRQMMSNVATKTTGTKTSEISQNMAPIIWLDKVCESFKGTLPLPPHPLFLSLVGTIYDHLIHEQSE